MEMFDSVMIVMLVGLAGAAAISHRSGNEKRDVRLLAVLTTLWGAGTAAALVA